MRNLLALLTVIVVVMFACTHENLDLNNPINIPTVSSPCSPDSVYFVSEIMPIIASNCAMSGCHDAATHAEGVNLTSYARILKYVTPGNPSNSELYSIITTTNSGHRMPPPPRSPLTTAQITKIQKWILQGARNNSCVGGCDTTQFTYAAVIKPMMDTKCVGCHRSGSLGGNIDLSTYTGTRVVALNGKLLGSISQLAGFSPMPKNMAKLSDCEITQVRKWINAGSLNN